MIRFIKENSYDIFRLILIQIAMAVFGLVMNAAAHQNNILYYAVAVFGIILYLVICYTTSRSVGEKDFAPVNAGRKAATPFKGLFMGLSANILNIIAGILVFVCSFFLVYQPQSEIIGKDGKAAEVYVSSVRTANASNSEEESVIPDKVDPKTLTKVNLYTNHGDKLYTYEYKESANIVKIYESGGSPAENTLQLYDKDGNKTDVYGIALQANTQKDAFDNTAKSIFTYAFFFCIFIQINFIPIINGLFGGATWCFIVTPLFGIAAAALGYYLASKGKRLLPFLPERNIPKRFF